MNAATKGISLRHPGRCLSRATNPKATYSQSLGWSSSWEPCLSRPQQTRLLCNPPGEDCCVFGWRPCLPDFNYTVCLAERQHINLICLTACNNTHTSTAWSAPAQPPARWWATRLRLSLFRRRSPADTCSTFDRRQCSIMSLQGSARPPGSNPSPQLSLCLLCLLLQIRTLA